MRRTMWMIKFLWAALGAMVLAMGLYVLVPLPEDRLIFFYDGIAAVVLAVAWAAVLHLRPGRRTGWLLLLAGHSTWALGDVAWGIDHYILGNDEMSIQLDLLYMSAYVLLIAGALRIARPRRSGRDVNSTIDAAIIAAGAAVPAAVIFVAPATNESARTTLSNMIGLGYSLGDLLLLALAVRLMVAPRGRSWPMVGVVWSLIVCALGALVVWSVVLVVDNDGQIDSHRGHDLVWLVGWSLFAAAALRSRGISDDEATPAAETLPSPRRLFALGAASLMPAGTLFAAGSTGAAIPWLLVSLGGAVLTVLVLVRMIGLLDRVRTQAVQLSALARSDQLTGIPNRRTWDHELARACAAAREHDQPLCVAILDLDHFKAYNDAHGHPVGDVLLRDAAAAWTAALGDVGMLARYGGEEFAMLLPRMDLAEAARCVDRLRHLTPDGQTFSAGVARWEPGSEPPSALQAADMALYHAKRSGRDRVEVAGAASTDILPAHLRALRVVLQPIVDPGSGEVVAHEALARFPHEPDVVAVFAKAHHDGHGDVLEATAVLAALDLPGRPAGTDLFVNVSGAALASDRFWNVVPEDLRGVVIELLEDRDEVDWQALRPRLDTLVARGARLAVDDLGAVSGDLARLLTIRPEIVKVDRGVIDGCATDPTRLRLVCAVVELAHAGGALVCAEGIESGEDLEALVGAGIDLAQGYFLGRPAPGWAMPVTLSVAEVNA